MQEWLDNNDTPMYSTHSEGKSVIAERFIKTLKAKIYKKMTANYSKSYLSYLSRLVDRFNITILFKNIIILLIKSLLMLIFLLWLKKLRQILKLLRLKLMTESELLNIRIFLVNVTLKIGQEKYLLWTVC